MLVWMGYLLVISGIMTAAAFSLERAIQPYGVATRWIWVCALFGSLALPLTLSLARSHAATSRAAVGSPPGEVRQVWAADERTGWTTPVSIRLVGSEPTRLDTLLEAAWLASTAITAALLLCGWWYGHRRRRSWRRTSIAGTELLIAKDAGPAAVGLLRPQIVLPEWLVRTAPTTLRLVIAHERSHVEARDPGLLGLAMGVAALLPWNGLVWCQVHRLCLAIEVDCDRRVLRLGHDARRYARTLVAVSARQPAHLGGLGASPRSVSCMERRIIIMNTPRMYGWRTGTVARAVLAMGIAAAAPFISPPVIPSARAGIRRAQQPTSLSRYVGDYQLSTLTVLQVGLRNRHLIANLPGMKPQPLTWRSGQVFRLGHSEADVRFAADLAGLITGLVLQQNGAATEAPRIGAGRVQAIETAIAERIRAQAPMPGSETALRELILGIESGKPHYAELSPQLAAGTRAMLSQLQATLKPWGGLRSLEFRGVDSKGWDHYSVRFERGSASWGIALDSYGVVVGAGMTHPG